MRLWNKPELTKHHDSESDYATYKYVTTDHDVSANTGINGSRELRIMAHQENVKLLNAA